MILMKTNEYGCSDTMLPVKINTSPSFSGNCRLHENDIRQFSSFFS